MPHTYTQIWFHIVFGTKNREPLIASEWRGRIHSYIGGAMRGLGALPSTRLPASSARYAGSDQGCAYPGFRIICDDAPPGANV